MNTSDTGAFAGKVAFVTGAGSGMGHAIALAFAQAGASVAVADIVGESAQATASEIRDAGASSLALSCDITRPEEVEAAINDVASTFGRLDVAANNAGLEQQAAETAEITDQEWERVLAVNLTGVFHCMKFEIPLMLASRGGAIVNTSSGAGVFGVRRKAAYTAAKHGVIGLTRSAALEYAHRNLRINAICPGNVDTPMLGRFTGGTPEGRERAVAAEPIGRLGTPDEIANAVLWLCSKDASFVVGHAMSVDGGQSVGR